MITIIKIKITKEDSGFIRDLSFPCGTLKIIHSTLLGEGGWELAKLVGRLSCGRAFSEY